MFIVTVSRKPMSEPTVARNTVVHGTGSLDIQSSRIGQGRWPTNLVLTHPSCSGVCDPTCPIPDLDGQSGILQSGTGAIKKSSSSTKEGNQGSAYGAESRPQGTPMISYGDRGGASRYFRQVGRDPTRGSR